MDNPITDGVSFSRYVPHARVEAYLALGWVQERIAKPAHHDAYSQILTWPGPGIPVEPNDGETRG